MTNSVDTAIGEILEELEEKDIAGKMYTVDCYNTQNELIKTGVIRGLDDIEVNIYFRESRCTLVFLKCNDSIRVNDFGSAKDYFLIITKFINSIMDDMGVDICKVKFSSSRVENDRDKYDCLSYRKYSIDWDKHRPARVREIEHYDKQGTPFRIQQFDNSRFMLA